MGRNLHRLLLFLCLGVASCSAMHDTTLPKGAVTHIVILWLKNPHDETARKTVIDECQKLRAIPGVISLTTGRPIPSTRPVVDSSYDVAMVVQFDNEQSMKSYLTNPIHQKSLKEVLLP